MFPTSSNEEKVDAPLSPDFNERRKNLRFHMQFVAAVWVPRLGKDWLPCKTISVGIRGATLETTVALAVESCVDYIVTFPSELTHAATPLRVRFHGRVLRVEPSAEGIESYRVAVHTENYKFVRGAGHELLPLEKLNSTAG
jgi:hypothetical protein